MDPQSCERWQRLLLRIGGLLCATAIAGMVIPVSWMAFIHEAVGLGEFPSEPIVEYLARTASMFYALFGLLLWVLGGDVRVYRHAITFVSLALVAAGMAMVAVDVRAGLPWWWVALEGPVTVGYGLVILLLQMYARGKPPGEETPQDGGPASPDTAATDKMPGGS